MKYLLFYIWYVLDFYVDESISNENSLESTRDPIIYEYILKRVF